MSERVFYYLQVVSTLSVAFPLIAGVFRRTHMSTWLKLFMMFLAIGFAVDLSGWYFYLTRNEGANLYLRHGYDLFEAVFLWWIVARLSSNKVLTKLFSWLLVPLLLFWAMRFYHDGLMSAFKVSTQIVFAFGASYGILRKVEREQHPFRAPDSWILLGIFLYCFTTHFIMGLLSTTLSGMWYVHNIINVLTNLIYFAGLLLWRPTTSTVGSTSI